MNKLYLLVLACLVLSATTQTCGSTKVDNI